MPGELSLCLVNSDFSELAVFSAVYSLYTRISLTAFISDALGPPSEV